MKRIIFLATYGLLSLVIASTLVFSPFAVPVEKAEAGGGAGRSTLGLQIKQQGELSVSAVKNTITAAASSATAQATTALFIKENLLDGIAWAIAKQMVSNMTKSLVNWINSGFQGSPLFITDLQSYLVDALDSVAGEYIRSLGGLGEFICSPFRLDVQAALTISYAQARSGMPSGPTACTLSGIGDNIENFLNGTMSNWDQWFKVTANPQNTPYGAYLEAEAKLNARLVNAAGQEIEMASWGDGFLSKKICESIEGGGGGKKCTISTPGKVISEALTFQLSTGPRALIEADEVNEIIGALVNQLVLQAVKGVNGLLGLGGNSQYTDYKYENNGTSTSTNPYLDQMVIDGVPLNTETVAIMIEDQKKVEEEFLTLIDTSMSIADSNLDDDLGPIPTIMGSSTVLLMAPGLAATSTDGISETETSVSTLMAMYNDASIARGQAEKNWTALNDLQLAYEADESAEARAEIVAAYIDLTQSGTLTSVSKMEQKRVEWSRIVTNIP